MAIKNEIVDEPRALELRRIDVRGHIAGRVDIPVGPVIHIDRRNLERAVGMS